MPLTCGRLACLGNIWNVSYPLIECHYKLEASIKDSGNILKQSRQDLEFQCCQPEQFTAFRLTQQWCIATSSVNNFFPLANQLSALPKLWPLTARWWEWDTMEKTASWLACPWSTSLENASTTSLWSPRSAWQTTGQLSVAFGLRISKMVRQKKSSCHLCESVPQMTNCLR